MSCSTYRPLLWEYLAEEIAAESRPRLEEHLERCPACRGELQDLRQVLAGLPKIPQRPAAYWDYYHSSVMDRLRALRPEPDGLGLRRLWRWAPVMTGIFLLAGVFIYRDRRDRQKEEVEEAIVQMDVLEHMDILERDDFNEIVVAQKG